MFTYQSIIVKQSMVFHCPLMLPFFHHACLSFFGQSLCLFFLFWRSSWNATSEVVTQHKVCAQTVNGMHALQPFPPWSKKNAVETLKLVWISPASREERDQEKQPQKSHHQAYQILLSGVCTLRNWSHACVSDDLWMTNQSFCSNNESEPATCSMYALINSQNAHANAHARL